MKNLLKSVGKILKKEKSSEDPSGSANSNSSQLMIIPQDELEYQTYQTQIDGLTAQIEVTLDYQTVTPPMESHPNLLELVVRLNDPDQIGLVSPKELEEIRTISNEFVKQIDDAIYVGSVTSNSIYNAFLYVPSNPKIPVSLRSLNVPQKFSYDVRPDNGWQYYNELLPTLEEGERMINQKQITELLANGINISQPKEIEHSIIIDDWNLPVLSDELTRLGYQIISTENYQGQSGTINVRFKKVSNIQLDYITAETIQLYGIAESKSGSYVGWKIYEKELEEKPTIQQSTVQPNNNVSVSVVPSDNESININNVSTNPLHFTSGKAVDHIVSKQDQLNQSLLNQFKNSQS